MLPDSTLVLRLFIILGAGLSALTIAAGAAVGGLVGAKVGRRLPANLLRAVILVIGTVALINLLLN